MAVIVSAPPALSGELSLFHTTDPLLSNSPVLVFQGPASSINATSSRIQVHIFTPAGNASYARLAVSPNSEYYSAVNNLPREEQGDETCRSIAFGLKKYFLELPAQVKEQWCTQAKAPSPSTLFGDAHIAILASRMARIENVEDVILEIKLAFVEQRLPWLDVDVVLPAGAIKAIPISADSAGLEEWEESQLLTQRFGRYAELIDCFGDLVFMPTSKLKRAPSKPTTVGRTASFLKQQKETVRKELCELLNTEESYVGRITELQDLANADAEDEVTTQTQIRSVFPDSIAAVVKLNTEFFADLRSVYEATETTALQDLEAMEGAQPTPRQAREDFVSDTQGIGAIAKCLCEWFPRFSEAYHEYMQGQTRATLQLRSLLRTGDAAVVTSLQKIGEQKLTSLLIEPVQRLPRYNLYIDTIVKQLPVRHPAIKLLLKARDTITEICDQDHMDAGVPAVLEKLKSRVSGWPAESNNTGRLVTAVDFVELLSPYSVEGCEGDRGILLVFTNTVVLVEKRGDPCISAKALLTELESGQAPLRLTEIRPATPHDLSFVRKVQFDAVDVLESQDGKCLQLITKFGLDPTSQPPQAVTIESYQTLRLEGLYERKAERLIEEISKARLEGRFSEPEREGAKWEVRASDPAADTTSILSAVYEDSCSEHVAARTSPAPIRIIVDIDRHSQRPRAKMDGLQTIVSASPSRDGLWRLSFDSIDGTVPQEYVQVSDVVTILRRRLTMLAASRFAIEHPLTTPALLSRNLHILQTVKLQAANTEDDNIKSETLLRDRSVRPKSPKKFLSSLLSSTGPGSQPPAFLKKDLPPIPPPSRLPSIQSNTSTMKPPSRESRPASRDIPTPKSMVSTRSTEQQEFSFKKLEDSLSTYLLALQARKGNIVGRSLKMRATADELAVNELYNSVLEDPALMVLAAQATVDVLFAAFEKFLNVAWKEQIGQVLPAAVLQDIQLKAETLFPADFDEYFKTTIGQLPPQNQRAFKCMVKLLADLLDGTGNDGDRGILTAAFAEVLVTEGNPHDYIALIDRFVDDPDTYFGEPLEDTIKNHDNTSNPPKRARSVNSASINSNTSSLRKRFGLGGLTRENSKSEQESKVASVWRTLSKSTRGDASPANSISKGSLYRSYSTDIDAGPSMPSRPVSQDGSPAHKASYLGDDISFTTSALNLGLSTIGEHPSFIPTQPPKKKRRSSLSDLKALNDVQQVSPKAGWSPSAARKPPVTQKYMDDKSLPNSPMPSTPSSKGGSGRFGSPTRETPRSRLPSSFRKENSPGPTKAFGNTPEQRPKSSGGKLDEVVITTRPTSNIPTLTPKPLALQRATTSPAPRTGLAERPGAGNIMKKPSPQAEKAHRSAALSGATDTGSPKKLRMQSPQKLRERLQNEQSAVAAAHTSLQDELSKIGDELTSTPSRIGSVRTPNGTSHTRAKSMTSTAYQSNNMDLAQRVLKLEGQLPKKVEELSDRLSGIQSDLATSLTVSESKCKKLDELYREANGENEALYSRFNDELGRILKAVKGGEGVEELKKKLRESQEEVAKLRRETSRLKRENVGLRAQMRE